MSVSYRPDLDIGSSRDDVVVNTVNCVGVMGSGVAKSVSRAWPSVLPPYVEACRSGRLRPGMLHVHKVPDGPIIVNMATKDHWRDPSSPDWVGSGLFFLSLFLQRHLEQHPGSIRSVSIPPPGCGLGGLSWPVVHPMLRSCLHPLVERDVLITVTADQPGPISRPMIYAGVGSRKAPDPVLKVMRDIGSVLSSSGYLLRSGGAVGSDTAFEDGARSSGGATEIFLAGSRMDRQMGQRSPGQSDIHEISPMFDRVTRHLHPAPNALTSYGRRLMNRNGGQVFGRMFDVPADVLVCWTPDGSGSGGTGQAIRIAKTVGIPVVDLGAPEFSAMSVDRLLMAIQDLAMVRRSSVVPAVQEIGAEGQYAGVENRR